MEDEAPQKSKKSAKAAKEEREAEKEAEKLKALNDNICKPKKTYSAFFFYSIENREKVSKANPIYSITEVATQIGLDWHALTDKQK